MILDAPTRRPTPSWISTDVFGDVYGAADRIAAYRKGNVFKLTCCRTYTPLYDFSGLDGSNPAAGPLVDAHGNIFGTTSSGGAYGHGVVWEITP